MDNIKNKIKRLLDLSTNNANDNEREQAMLKAEELMQAHNLELADVYDKQEGGGVIEKFIDVPYDNWKQSVAAALKQIYYIGTYKVPRGRSQWSPMFVGTPENVEVAESMFRWLCESIRKEANARFSHNSDRESFRKGAGYALYQKATAQRQAEQSKNQADTPRANALMVIRDKREADVKDFMATKGLVSGRSRSSSVNPYAYSQGQSFGGGMSLNKQISGSKPKQIGMDK